MPRDLATENLEAIIRGKDYVLAASGVPLFDEHDEFDSKGALVRRFDRAKLQEIARNCNKRATETADLAPWGPGHTKDDAATEDDQPPIRGFYYNYRVGKYGPSGKTAVLADCYVKRSIKTADGKVIDGVEYAKGLPRRSVELWPSSMTIDWIAHLRRSPQRDLGMVAAARDPWQDEVVRYAKDTFSVSYSTTRTIVGSVSKRGKLRYSMENQPMAQEPINPTDAPTPAPEEEMAPEGHEDFVKHLDYAMAHHPMLQRYGAMCKKYEASMAAPTNAAVPGGADDAPPAQYSAEEAAKKKAEEDAELLKHMRNGTGDVRVMRFQKEIDDQKAETASLKKQLADTQHREKMQRYQRDLEVLTTPEGGGVLMNVQDELLEAAPMDDAKFTAFKERIKKNYQRDLTKSRVPTGMIDKDTGGPGTLEALGQDPDKCDQVIRYARDNGLTEKHGPQAFEVAAKALKFIK